MGGIRAIYPCTRIGIGITVVALALLPAFATEIPVLLDVLQLTGKSPKQVETLLGPGDPCHQTFRGDTCSYPVANVEIVYIDGRADWITVSGFEDLTFDHRAIQAIGLNPIPPTISNPFRMHWQYHHGLEVVSVYGSGRYVAFIQVRAYTSR